MAITPNGSPAWVRNADHTTYGGNAEKTNYQSRGVINALTDVGAEEFVRMVSDLAAVVRTAPFCVINVTGRDSTVQDPTVNRVTLQTGATASSYDGGSPPAGFPSVTRVGDGNYLVTFAATYADPYSVSGAFAPTHCVPSVLGAAGYDPGYQIGTNTVNIYCTNGGAGVQDQTLSAAIW